jgi:ribosomal protein S18 acetylase RimI-like enzyme
MALRWAMSELVVEELSVADVPAALAVASRAMRDNPLHVAVFGPSAARRERGVAALFQALEVILPQPFLGAWDGETLVGAVGLARPRGCRPSLSALIESAPRLTRSLPLATVTVPRTVRWLSAWHRADRKHPPHWHVGPLGVAPDRQGRGIGSRLLASCCELIDADTASAYLETDSPDSVRLFERFGFRTVGHLDLLRRRTWLMWRETQT